MSKIPQKDSIITNVFLQRDPGKEYKSTEDPGLKMDFVQIVFDNLLDTVSVTS